MSNAHVFKVLVVDDDVLLRKVLSYSLELLDCKVDLACDGEEAVEMFQKKIMTLYLWTLKCQS